MRKRVHQGGRMKRKPPAQNNPSEVVPQRWARPELTDMPPGFWKTQLPGKALKIAVKGNLEELRTLLHEQPEALNQRGNHGRTLLWEAVRAGKLLAVRYLLKAGADPDLTGAYNSESYVQLTPYCAAHYYDHAELQILLQPISAPADLFRSTYLGDDATVLAALERNPEMVNAEDPLDTIYQVPLIAFAMTGEHVALMTALIERGALLAPYSAQLLDLAARAGRIDWIDLLLAGGADIRAVTSGSFFTDVATAQHLLDCGAPANRVSFNGFTPLIFLARGDKGERLDLMQLLLDNGAEVNARGAHSKTALHYAAAAGSAGKIDLLLKHGANPSLKDDQDETALMLARASGKAAAIALLE
jgi:ankyrin repeat protein